VAAAVTSDDAGPGLLCLQYRFRLMFCSFLNEAN